MTLAALPAAVGARPHLGFLRWLAYPQWQADATYEAGRCFEVLNKKEQAIKQYRELIEKFPASDKAAIAKERIKAMQ